MRFDSDEVRIDDVDTGGERRDENNINDQSHDDGKSSGPPSPVQLLINNCYVSPGLPSSNNDDDQSVARIEHNATGDGHNIDSRPYTTNMVTQNIPITRKRTSIRRIFTWLAPDFRRNDAFDSF